MSEKGLSLEASGMVSNQKAIYCEDDVYLIVIRPAQFTGDYMPCDTDNYKMGLYPEHSSCYFKPSLLEKKKERNKTNK